MKSKSPLASRIRWAARITGSFLVLFTLILGIMSYFDGLVGNNGSPLSSFNTIIIILFIFWGIALAGLVIAIWKEGLGGCISLVSFVIMPVLNLFNPASPAAEVTLYSISSSFPHFYASITGG